MSDILVTGATGNVGSVVVDELNRAGVDAIAATRTGEPLGATQPNRTVELDFNRSNTFEPALAGVGAVFLIRPPAISRVASTVNRFLEVAAESGVEHVVFSSVAGAESNRVIPHHRIERRLVELPMANTILRPGFFAQNIGSAYRADIVERDEVYVPAGDGAVAFIDARDIAAVAARALVDETLRGGRFHLTGPLAVTFERVAELLTAHVSRPIRYRPASAVGYLRHLRRQEMAFSQALVQTVLHVDLRTDGASDVTDTLPELLGRPATTLDRYIADHEYLWASSSLDRRN